MSTNANIFIVEDEEDISQLIAYNLVKAGYQARCFSTAEAALPVLSTDLPDLLILDLMLPGMSGLELCSTLRSAIETVNIPILMLTARSTDDDIVAGLQQGADDYLPKPFAMPVLLARVAALIRRNQHHIPEDSLSFPSLRLRLDLNLHDATIDQIPCSLTFTEFSILKLLTNRPGWVYSRQQIIDNIRGFDYSLTSRAIDVQISALRKKLGKLSPHIQTIRGVGYRFAAEL